jgi:hypothetical protein
MPRTTSDAVIAILVYNYDFKRNPDLTGFIDTASVLVDQVVANALLLPLPVTVSAASAELIERWLAAYFYCKMDPLKTTKSTQGASGSYVSNGSSLEGEGDRYKRGAIEIDTTGCLHALLNRQTASAKLLRGCSRTPYGY